MCWKVRLSSQSKVRKTDCQMRWLRNPNWKPPPLETRAAGVLICGDALLRATCQQVFGLLLRGVQRIFGSLLARDGFFDLSF